MSAAEEGETSFEEMYASAGEDLEVIPWALLAAQPALVSWLDRVQAAAGQAALVVGCGYGDDAEELSRRELAGFQRAGLAELDFTGEPAGDGRGRTFTAVYQRQQ